MGFDSSVPAAQHNSGAAPHNNGASAAVVNNTGAANVPHFDAEGVITAASSSSSAVESGAVLPNNAGNAGGKMEEGVNAGATDADPIVSG